MNRLGDLVKIYTHDPNHEHDVARREVPVDGRESDRGWMMLCTPLSNALFFRKLIHGAWLTNTRMRALARRAAYEGNAHGPLPPRRPGPPPWTEQEQRQLSDDLGHIEDPDTGFGTAP
jgi:hypothetical protein